MAILERQRGGIIQNAQTGREKIRGFIDAQSGRTVEIKLPTIYLIDARVDFLLNGHEQPNLHQNEMKVHKTYFKLPQDTGIELARYESPEMVSRNIYYTNTEGTSFVYRSVTSNDKTKVTMNSSKNGQRNVFQTEGAALLKIMKSIERSRERKDKVKKVIDIFRAKQSGKKAPQEVLAA